MCNNANNDACKCIAEILEIINVLQQNACPGDMCLDTCDRKFLGCNKTSMNCNTRPITIYLSSGHALTMPISKDPTETTTSNVFRVEKVEGCCATLRVLTLNEATADYPYQTTNSFFTININCICCLRCLADTYVEGI